MVKALCKKTGDGKWYQKKNFEFNCEIDEKPSNNKGSCDKNFIISEFEKYLRTLNSPYRFSESDFHFKYKKNGFHAKYKCPNSSKVTGKIFFKCDEKKGVGSWKFGGDPAFLDCAC